ncbi:hypothetical protein A2U01_0100029, partial [Trifolium medium]|nr:hypothetical protein [Trifolium medium]
MVQNNWHRNAHIVANLQNLQNAFQEWKFGTIDKVMHEKRRVMARIG